MQAIYHGQRVMYKSTARTKLQDPVSGALKFCEARAPWGVSHLTILLTSCLPACGTFDLVIRKVDLYAAAEILVDKVMKGNTKCFHAPWQFAY